MPWNDDSKPGPWSKRGDGQGGERGPEAGGEAAGEADGRRRGPWDRAPSSPLAKDRPHRLPWRRLRSAATEPDPNRRSVRPSARKTTTPDADNRRDRPQARGQDIDKIGIDAPNARGRRRAPEGPGAGAGAGGPWGGPPIARPQNPPASGQKGADQKAAGQRGGARQTGERKATSPRFGPFRRPDPKGEARPRPAPAKRTPATPLLPPGPTLDELTRELRARFARTFGGRNGRGLRPGVIAGLVAVGTLGWAASGLYVVQADQTAVVTRFGAVVGESGPGLGWRAPWPIGRVRIVSVAHAHELEIGGAAADQNPADGLMLTGDGQVTDVDFTARWRVVDPRRYLFSVADPQATVRTAALNAMRQAVAGTAMAQMASAGRTALQAQAAVRMQHTLDSYGAGVKVSDVQIRSVSPPPEVVGAYREAAGASQDAEAAANDADAYRDRTLADARGDAVKVVQDAQGYSDQIVREAQGQAQHFDALEAQYRRAPALTRQRLYLETMEQVLAHARKLVLDLPKGSTAPIQLPPDLFRSGTGVVATPPPQTTPPTTPPTGATAPAQDGAAHPAPGA